MNRKFLEELLSVVEEDTTRKNIIDKIMDENGKTLEKQKIDIATLKNELKTKDGVIDNLNKKVEELNEIDVEKIKKEQFDLGKAEGSKEVETFKKNTALNKALENSKAKDISIIKKMLNDENISYKLENDNYVVEGLDKQIEEIKKSHDYLFNNDNADVKSGMKLGGTHSNRVPDAEPTDLRGALYEKYGK